MVLVDKPPKEPRVAKERMNTLGLVNCSAMRMRSPSKEPKLNGEVGSMANTAMYFPWALQWFSSAFTKVLLPAPGGPVMPIMGVALGFSPSKISR